jgi:hypothetical protein
VHEVREALDVYRRRLVSTDGNEAEFASAMQEFLDFLRGYKDLARFVALTQTPYVEEFRADLAPLVLRFTWLQETRAHARIMARHNGSAPVMEGWVDASIRGQYARMEELLGLVDFSACRRYVLMGSGKVPASLFFLHDRTTVARLVGIDRDAGTVRAARELVAHCGLDRIHIEQADAAAFDYGPYDVIYWDPFANPRRKVMERLLATARPGAVIILRDPFLAGTLLFESVMPYLDPRFLVGADSEAYPGRYMLKHYILQLAP